MNDIGNQIERGGDGPEWVAGSCECRMEETIKQQQIKIKQLKDQLTRVADWAYAYSQYSRGWHPYFEAGSKIDEILQPWKKNVNET